MRLKDKIAIVTGAAGGIGKEIARAFCAEGAKVYICDLSDSVGDSCKEIGGAGFYKVNVSVASEAAAMVDEIVKKESRIDILVNNAGITRDGLIMRMKDEDWKLVLDINLTGTFNFTKAVTRALLKQRAGVIVNIASVIGVIGNAGQANYAASKAGIIGLTKSCAKEFGSRGIRVNAIAPGFIKTKMTDVLSEETKASILATVPMGRLGEPAEVARLAVFLASDDAAYITGQVVNLDGGMVM